MAEEVRIQIVDEGGAAVDELDYLPWGTRSLKLKVSGDYGSTMHLLPLPPIQGEERIEYITHAAGSGAIHVSWGGGWERGVEIKKLSAKHPVYAFFNLTHQGQAEGQYAFQVAAFDEADVQYANPLGQAQVKLNRPTQTDQMTFIRADWVDSGSGGTRDLVLGPPAGDGKLHVPQYLSRWWPKAEVTYLDTSFPKVGEPPRIRLKPRPVSKGTKLEIELLASRADEKPKCKARFVGDIAFPLADLERIRADLYSIEGHWALRVWFFWIDKVFPKAYLEELSQVQRRALEDLKKGWQQIQEIPDAERVDFIFDHKHLNLRFLGTDSHWRELWARPEDKTKAPVIKFGAKSLPQAMVQAIPQLAPLLRGIGNPVDRIMMRLSSGSAKGPGEFPGNHWPRLSHVVFDPALGSGDVTKG
jgi:hypothetical protein